MKDTGKNNLEQPLTDRVSNEQYSRFRPDTFEWENLNYFIKSNDRQVLCEAFGTVKKGEVYAIVGSSGAGKTTLLNVLAYKSNSRVGRFEGKICIDGVEVKSKKELYKVSSYLRQDDVFYSKMTPRQALTFQMDMISDESGKIKKGKIN